ncbi:MAG: nucleoside triphosphate pyrophosphohydrolase [Cellulosilyticaceae bacterium]
MANEMYTYNDLVKIIAKLRSEDGCPWDREQTHESLRSSVLEETYELVEAINNKDQENIKEELGDLLLQVLMHAQIAKENNSFTLEEVVDGIAAKLVYRHPHVFGEQKVSNTDEVLDQWEVLKKKEKKHTSQSETMDHIAKALPALVRAEKIIKKAGQVGFKWEQVDPIYDKVKEELEEVRKATNDKDFMHVEEELGDLLFSVVNLTSFLQVNPEFALTKSMEKFINRFRYIENSAFVQGKQLSDMTLYEMDTLWEECKKVESNC